MQQFDEALDYLERALACDLEPERLLEAKRLQGTSLALSGRKDEAIALWRQLISNFPEDYELMEDMIDLQAEEGLLDEALRTAKKLVASSKDPYQKALNQIVIGDILIRKNDHIEAKTHLSDMIDRVGADSWLEKEILAKLDQLISGMNNFDSALNFYSELRERYPQRVAIRKRSIQALARSGEVDAAITEYQELLRMTPGDRENREAFIEFLESSDRMQAAVENSIKLCKLYPQDPGLRLKHAILLNRIDDRESLLETVREYDGLLGKSTSERLKVARVYDQFSFYEESGAIYSKLVESNANNIEAVENYAVWLLEQNRKDEALNLLQSLASDVDREGLIRMTRTLSGRFLQAEAYELLKSRLDDFNTDSLYLIELCNLAIAESVAHEALGWARTLLLKAESPFEVSSAVNLAVSVFQKADEIESILTELGSRDELKLQELCLKAQLGQVIGDLVLVDATIKRIRERGGIVGLSEIARIYEMQGRTQEAVLAMEELILLDEGKNPLNLRRIVGLMEQLQSWDRALKYLGEWKLLTPGDSKVWLRESDLLQAAGREEEAIKQLLRGLYKFDEDLDLTLRLASLFRSTNEHAEAARIYWRLYNQEEQDSERLRWIRELAILHREKATTDELIEELKNMRKQQSESVFPLLALAEVYRENNYSDLHRESLVEAANLQPDNPELLQQLASLHEMNGELAEAEQTLKELVRLDKSSTNINLLSAYYLRIGDTEQAYDLILQSAPDGGRGPREMETIIDSLVKSDEWEIALEQARDAAAKFPEDWRLGYLLAVCLEATGRDVEAFEKWLTLMRPQKEILGLSSLTTTHRSPGPTSSGHFLHTQMSPGVKSLQYAQTTFSHLNQNSRQPQHSSLHFSGFGLPAVTLPHDLESLRAMCSLQLGAIASDWPEQERAQAVVELRRSGVENAPLLVALGGGRFQQSMPGRLLSYIRENPDDLDALPLVLTFAHRQRSSVLDDVLLRGFRSYQELKPGLASEFALVLIARNNSHAEELLDYIIEHMSFEDDAAIVASSRILVRFQSMLSVNRNPSFSELSDSHHEQLLQRIADFYFSDTAVELATTKTGLFNQVFNVLAMLYIRKGDTLAFINLMEEQADRLDELLKNKPTSSNPLYASYNRGVSHLNLQVPSFQQSYHLLAHPMISGLLARLGTQQAPRHGGLILSEESRSRLDLEAHVDNFERPEFKIIVHWTEGNTDACGALFKEILASGASPQLQFVYATWLIENNNDKTGALKVLESLLKGPGSAQDRMRDQQAY
ncbi:MAG: tetratricopeptide repeat protein, partial [Opitutales bacterium]